MKLIATGQGGAIRTVNAWALSYDKKDLPEDSSSYKHRAISYLQNNSEFDTEGFANMVVKDDDAKRKEKLIQSLKEKLVERGISVQHKFKPQPNSIDRKIQRNKRTTKEGVTITWEGDMDSVGIKIEALEDDRQKITIETNQLIVKE